MKTLLCTSLFFTVSLAQTWIVSTVPQRYSSNAPDTATIVIQFSEELLLESVTDSNIILAGTQSGYHSPSFAFSTDKKSVILKSAKHFFIGEKVYVTLTRGIKNSEGVPLPQQETWYFTIAPKSGTGIFSFASDHPTFYNPWLPIVADFDNDGDADVVTVCTSSDGNNVLFNSVTVYRNDHANLGSSSMTLVSHLSVMGQLRNGVAGDFDKDGDMDIAITDSYLRRIIILKNDGAMNFSTDNYVDVDGRGANAIATNDIDGDGDLDLVVGNTLSSQVIFLKNNGLGSFTQAGSVTDAHETETLVLDDLDGDGDPDLVVGNVEWASSSVYENKGNFTFAKATTIDNGKKRSVPVAADLDNDGDLDLVFNSLDNLTPLLLVLRNNGQFSFTQADTFSLGNTMTAYIQCMDVYNNGFQDIVAVPASNVGSGIILKNSGDFKFTQTNGFHTSNTYGAFAPADIDGDGDIDIVQSNYYNNTISIFRNAESFAQLSIGISGIRFNRMAPDSSDVYTFTIRNTGIGEQLTISSITAGNPAFTVRPLQTVIGPNDSMTVTVTFSPAKAAVYNDSLVFVSNDPRFPVQSIPLTGMGNYVRKVSPEPNTIAHTANPKITIFFTDDINLNSFDASEIVIHGSVTGKHQTGTLTINQDDNSISCTPVSPFSPNERVTVTIIKTVNTSDGSNVPSPTSWIFTAYARKGGASFTEAPSLNTGVSFYEWQPMSSADLNNDGLVDVMIPAYNSGSIKIFKNNGNMSFAAAVSISTQSYPRFIGCGDIDNDGDVDIAVIHDTDGKITLIRNNGSFSFSVMGTISSGGSSDQHIIIADLNGDGFQDIGVANTTTNTVTLLKGNGLFGFTLQQTIPVPAVKSLDIGDVDSDGDLDLIASKSESKNFTYLRNEGDFEFAAIPLPSFSPYIRTMILRDFDNDRDVDIIASSSNNNSIGILKNNGKGVFSHLPLSNINGEPLWLDAGDIDGDYDVDIVTTNNSFGGGGSIYVNSFAQQQDPFQYLDEIPLTYANYISLHDYDGDGDLDIASPLILTNTITFLTNSDWNTRNEKRNIGTVKLNTPIQLSFTLYNYGIKPLSVDSIAVFSNLTDSISQTSATIAGGDSTVFTVFLTVKNFGMYNGSVNIYTDDPHYKIKSIEFSISSLEPSLTFNKGSINFGAVGLYDSIAATVQLLNPSANSVLIDSIYSVRHKVGISYSKNEVALGETVYVVISYTADTLEVVYDTLVVETSIPRKKYSLPIFAYCPQASPYTSLYFLQFGTAEVDSASKKQIKIINGSPTSAFMDSMYLSTQYFSLTSSQRNIRLTQKDTLIVTVSFLADTVGTFYDTLEIQFSIPVTKLRVPIRAMTTILAVESNLRDHVPDHFMLNNAYPNPFNPTTTISFGLPLRSFATLTIFDITGREIATILSKELSAGNHSCEWNAKDLPSGIYFYRIHAGTFLQTKKLLLIK